MAQKYDLPKSEEDLRTILDDFYLQTKQHINDGESPRFKGLLEIMMAETTILSAIHKIKANKGANTPGSDQENLKTDILQRDYISVVQRVQEALMNYSPRPVRRKYIDKPGKKEKRPLGIPSIIDRIVQECVRIVIEPILEAQFFTHSYGFRPMRSTSMALERMNSIIHKGYYWLVEGDISKFFDNVDHRVLIKKLWSMGIRDRRVLMIIKAMLKAGVMNESPKNELGTPQGGIISPLLANVYLHKLDKWVVREWEEKKTKKAYASDVTKKESLHNTTNLKPAYFVRYADDWVLITKTKSSAEKWKRRISRYLGMHLKLKLSDEKTLVTDVRKRSAKFAGYEVKAVKGKAKRGFVTRTRPNRDRLSDKVKELSKNIRYLRRFTNKELLIHHINKVNSQIRGTVEYYKHASYVTQDLGKYAEKLSRTALCALRRHGVDWTPCNEVGNLLSIHSQYKHKIPAIKYQGLKVGVTRLDMVSWQKAFLKNPKETPYTKLGRELYENRTSKKPILSRADELLTLHLSKLISTGRTGKRYNFEYFLNRAYVYNRDKGKCRVCGFEVQPQNLHIHHVHPMLPLENVNRVPFLATVHEGCHKYIHSSDDFSHLGQKIWKKILSFREKVQSSPK